MTSNKIISANFKNILTIKSNLNEISSLFVINSNYIAVCGRFESIIEIYNLKTSTISLKLETNYKEGVKTLLILSKQNQPSEYVLIAGCFASESYMKSWRLQTIESYFNKTEI